MEDLHGWMALTVLTYNGNTDGIVPTMTTSRILIRYSRVSSVVILASRS